jgi:hypothetical protein
MRVFSAACKSLAPLQEPLVITTRCSGDRMVFGPWQSSGIVYPGGAAVGACGVVGGLLGYLTTYPFVTPGLVEIQLCVFSSIAGEAPCCTTIFFELQRNLVWIRGLEGLSAATPPGLFDPTAQITDGSGVVRSFGTALRVFGSADVGGCSGQTIKRLTFSYQQGLTNSTAGAWTKFWEVDYVTSLELDAGTNLIFEDVLTKEWSEEEWFHFVPLPAPHFVCDVVGNYLSEAYWDTQSRVGLFQSIILTRQCPAERLPWPPGTRRLWHCRIVRAGATPCVSP